jgi:hypothetical protein
VYRNGVSRSHNHCCDGKQQCVLCVFLSRNVKCSQKIILRRIYAASSNETYLGLHVKCPTFMPDFNEI